MLRLCCGIRSGCAVRGLPVGSTSWGPPLAGRIISQRPMGRAREAGKLLLDRDHVVIFQRFAHMCTSGVLGSHIASCTRSLTLLR